MTLSETEKVGGKLQTKLRSPNIKTKRLAQVALCFSFMNLFSFVHKFSWTHDECKKQKAFYLDLKQTMAINDHSPKQNPKLKAIFFQKILLFLFYSANSTQVLLLHHMLIFFFFCFFPLILRKHVTVKAYGNPPPYFNLMVIHDSKKLKK